MTDNKKDEAKQELSKWLDESLEKFRKLPHQNQIKIINLINDFIESCEDGFVKVMIKGLSRIFSLEVAK